MAGLGWGDRAALPPLSSYRGQAFCMHAALHCIGMGRHACWHGGLPTYLFSELYVSIWEEEEEVPHVF